MTELARRAGVFAALAEPKRLEIVDLLTLGDLSPSEIESLLSLRSNLVAHHLHVLARAGIVTKVRSEFDRRRSYVQLFPEVFDTLMPRTLDQPERVVFVCTANSARSQLAEAIWRDSTTMPAVSAGMRPAPAVNPGALAVALEHGHRIDPETVPRHVDDVIHERDLVVTVCDSAHELMNGRDDLHWSIPDPAGTDDPSAFELAYAGIARRVHALWSRIHHDTLAD